MYAQAIDGVWFDVGHPFELLNAQSTLIERYDELPFTYPNNFVEFNGVLTASSSSMNGTAADAVIGSSCVVGHESKLERALLMDGCEIGAGSQIIESVLGRNVQVGDGCRFTGASLATARFWNPTGIMLISEFRIESAHGGERILRVKQCHIVDNMSSTPHRSYDRTWEEIETMLERATEKNESVERMVRCLQRPRR